MVEVWAGAMTYTNRWRGMARFWRVIEQAGVEVYGDADFGYVPRFVVGI